MSQRLAHLASLIGVVFTGLVVAAILSNGERPMPAPARRRSLPFYDDLSLRRYMIAQARCMKARC